MTQVLAIEDRALAPQGADDHRTLEIATVDDVLRSKVEFVQPLLGFPGSQRFVLGELGARFAPFQLMSSLDEPGLDFIVVAPGLVYDDYVIEVPEADAALIDVRDASEIDVLVLVSRHRDTTPTVNLMGPIVRNHRSGQAVQIVLQDGRYGAAVAVGAKSARNGPRDAVGSR